MFGVDKRLNYGRDHIDYFATLVEKPVKVLDVGAGQGDDLQIVSKHFPHAEYYALECYKPYIETLNSKGISTFSVNFEREPLPFENESLDLIISNQTLEHTKEVFWVLHEMTRCLRVGGYLMIGVPNLASLHNRMLLLLGRQPTSINNSSAHIRGFTKPDLLRLFDVFKGGFTLKEYKGSNFYPFSPEFAKPLARSFPTMAWSNFFLLQKVKSYQKQYIEFPIVEKLETNFYIG